MIKLAKGGGMREALRMVHAARALGLSVMLGCMIESELGIALSAQLGRSSTTSTSTGTCYLLAAVPGLGLATGGSCSPSARPGSGAVPDRLALFTGGPLPRRARENRPRHPALRRARGGRVVDDTRAGPTAEQVVPYTRRRCRS